MIHPLDVASSTGIDKPAYRALHEDYEVSVIPMALDSIISSRGRHPPME